MPRNSWQEIPSFWLINQFLGESISNSSHLKLPGFAPYHHQWLPEGHRETSKQRLGGAIPSINSSKAWRRKKNSPRRLRCGFFSTNIPGVPFVVIFDVSCWSKYRYVGFSGIIFCKKVIWYECILLNHVVAIKTFVENGINLNQRSGNKRSWTGPGEHDITIVTASEEIPSSLKEYAKSEDWQWSYFSEDIVTL